MYHSISVRVLRQAMDWMGIPCPWFRTVSAFTFPNGDYSSVVKCMWNYSEIIDYIDQFYQEHYDVEFGEVPVPSSTILERMLEEAFCDDIQVSCVRYFDSDRLFCAYLSCRIERQPDSGKELLS